MPCPLPDPRHLENVPALSVTDEDSGTSAALLGESGSGLLGRLAQDSTAGTLLVLAALAAVAWATIDPSSYAQLWGPAPARHVGILALPGGGLEWVNQGAMALFFLVVGLELSREIRYGDLRSPRAALTPVAAALGGMAGAAIVYVAIAHSGVPAGGYGVPMATDVAFAVGSISLFGRRIPLQLRLFVLALAVADDLASLAVLVLGYSERLDLARLVVAAATVVAALLLRWTRRDRLVLVVALGIGCWLALEGSGVEPALAGVFVGLLARSPTHGGPTSLESRLRPVVNGAVLPVFALANAGVALGALSLKGGAGVVLTAVLAARIVGKAAGIVLVTVLLARRAGAALPGHVSLRTLAGVGALCGVGFTVPLLIAGRAFLGHPAMLAAARLGLLAGSVGAFALGAFLLVAAPGARRRSRARPGYQ